MKDWTGNGNSIFKTLGASSHTDKVREVNDYYATEPKAAELLIQHQELHTKIWECACGEGHLSEVFKSHGFDVFSSDLVDRGYGDDQIDFLEYYPVNQVTRDIVTNPPYKYAKEFVEHALDIVADDYYVCMFLKIQFLEGKTRKALFEKYPPQTIYVSSSRLLCAKNAEFDKMRDGGGSAVAYAWFVWQKGYGGGTTVKWIN